MHLYQKYAPKNLKEFAGNPDVVENIKKWALLFENGKVQKPILLYGPPGIGKTALAYALAGEMGWSILEFNASDTRNKDNVERVMGAASSSAGLFSRRKLILIDEVDGLEGTADRGGVSAIVSILKSATQPIILTANDAWDKKLTPLRGNCTFIEMKRVNKRTVHSVISDIAHKEHIRISDDMLQQIAESSDGDIRSAIIDLQVRQPGMLRDREHLIFECMKDMFKAQDYISALKSFDNSTLDHNMIKLWIEQNISNEYESADEIARAYDYLSRADMYDGRIVRRQAWKLLKYSNAVMLTGVSLSKKERYHKFVKYEFPTYIRSMSMTSEKRSIRKSVLRKIAHKCHCSVSDAGAYLFLLKELLKKEGDLGYFEFSDDELTFIKKV